MKQVKLILFENSGIIYLKPQMSYVIEGDG